MLICLLSDGPSLPNGNDFVNKVFPNVWSFLVQLIAFIIMSIIVIKFAYKPVSNYLKKRQEFISENLSSAQEKNDMASKLTLEAESNLVNSRKEALQIIEIAKNDAEKERQKILEETKKEISNKRVEFEQELLLEKEKVMQDVQNDVIDLVLDASEHLLSREVSSQDNQKLLDDFINDLAGKE